MLLKHPKAIDIEAKLEKARERADHYGALYGRFATADDYLKTVYASLRDEAPAGTVDDRDAWVKRQAEYVEAVKRKQNAAADWKAAEVWMKLLLAEIDVWRSQEASNRWIDKSHT